MLPDTGSISKDSTGAMIRYGRQLITNTAYYIGPSGTKGHYLGNKMNCSNCHVDAGTRTYGLNFLGTYARYPQYRGRENKVLSLAERVNNCIERPHNGNMMPVDGKEMNAILAYMKWLSENTKDSMTVNNISLQYPERPADPNNGAIIYKQHCMTCHGKDGEGVLNPDSSTYIYPPLWGVHSFQKGSSPHRILMLAKFIKANMPDKIATWQRPLLTDEQAIDVAAFINDDRIHERPGKKGILGGDYPIPRVKPIDYPYGPYADTFSGTQHKFGPYLPIIHYYEQKKMKIFF